jgi:hypothetical protein
VLNSYSSENDQVPLPVQPIVPPVAPLERVELSIAALECVVPSPVLPERVVRGEARCRGDFAMGGTRQGGR